MPRVLAHFCIPKYVNDTTVRTYPRQNCEFCRVGGMGADLEMPQEDIDELNASLDRIRNMSDEEIAADLEAQREERSTHV